uniref:Non-LTR retroelement reverse transcriptase n=1 Tax=Solanum tuberosum TaxID=4113 RepID=M1D937_SOLTU
MPTVEELKEVVFSMNPNSAAGPDGMNGYFFQKCWHIIKKDLFGVIQAFFCGQMIPKYFSHSCIVLLPKVSNPNKLTEFRPISGQICRIQGQLQAHDYNLSLHQMAFELEGKCVHDIKVTLVKRTKPPTQWVKINTDGSALSNPGRTGAGGIIRDQAGEMLLAFATPLGEGTNNQAEVEATIFGMTWSLELGHKNVLLEVDSQLLVDWIMQKINPHWSISTQLEKLQALIDQTQEFKCKVVYLDTASIKRTRASMAKVKVQVDLTKARPRHLWIGLDEKDLTIGRWQTIEYESIPPYCEYCKHQGHMIYECNFKIRDEEFKKMKELEVEKKDKNKGEQMPKGNDNK